MAKYINVTDTAKLVRKALKRTFKGTKFRVRSERYAGGSSVSVSWTDGPTVAQVDEVAKLFQGANFDSMQDLMQYHTTLLSNADGSVEEVRFGADFVSTYREMSPKVGSVIVANMSAELGEEPTGYDVRLDVRKVNDRPTWVSSDRGEEVGTLVYRYFVHLDLR